MNPITPTAEFQALPEGTYTVLAKLNAAAIEVEDTGGGISPNIIGRVFDLFFTTKDKGSGLGLSVAHKIVAQHGGVLAAENISMGTISRLTLRMTL